MQTEIVKKVKVFEPIEIKITLNSYAEIALLLGVLENGSNGAITPKSILDLINQLNNFPE